jgi:hypothetical protein
MEDIIVRKTQTTTQRVVEAPVVTGTAIAETTETVDSSVRTEVTAEGAASIGPTRTVITRVSEPARPPGHVTTVVLGAPPVVAKRATVTVIVPPTA